MTRRLPRWLLWPLLGLYALVFGEVFTRVMDPQALMPRYVTGTDYGIRGNIPNARYRHRTPEVDVEVRINAQGMRADREFPTARPEGTCRIALLGDSYFLGYEADLADSIAGRLEQALAAAGHRVEVLNFAVSGFGTAEMLRAFEARVAAFEPDAVFYQFHTSDFGDNLRAPLYRLRPDGSVEATGADYLPGIAIRDRLMESAFYRWLITESHLYTLLRERLAETAKAALAEIGRLRAAASEPPPAAAAPAGAGTDGAKPARPGARLTAALLRAAREAAEARGVAFFVVDAAGPGFKGPPVTSQIGDVPLDPATADRLIRTEPRLSALHDQGHLIHWQKGHYHYTPLGNRVVAEEMARALEAREAARLAACPTESRQATRR